VPRTRVEYISPAPILWLHDAIWYRGEAFIDFLGPAFVPYQSGQRTDEWWFGAPLHAQGYGDRGADWMFVGAADLRDTGGHNGYPWEFSEDPVATRAFRLYRNGRLVASAQDPFMEARVPVTRAQYRLERDLDLDGLTRLANRSRTRWWFLSAAPAGQDPYAILPLLTVDYQAAPLGGRNGAVAGQPVTIDLRVARQEGAKASPVVARTCGSRPTTGPPGARWACARSNPATTGASCPAPGSAPAAGSAYAPGPATPPTAASTRLWCGPSRCADPILTGLLERG
jgi:hypothetical protein